MAFVRALAGTDASRRAAYTDHDGEQNGLHHFLL